MVDNKRIGYLVATGWLSLGMVSTGVVQVLRTADETARMNHLGFPVYLLTLLAIWKFLGVIAILIPKFTLLKEWAYAGFFFLMSGALYAHAACRDELMEYFGPALLLVLTVISWSLKPSTQKQITG